MKKKSRWIVAVGLVLALVLAVAPTQVLAVDVPVDPNGPYNVNLAETFTVDIEIGDVTDLCAVDLEVGYDNTVIDFVAGSAVKGGIWGGATVIVTETDFADSIKIGLQNTGCNPMSPGVSGPGTLVQLSFTVIGVCDDTSVLDMSSYAATNKLFNRFGMEIAASWGDSSVTVEPCGPPLQHIVVSGQCDGTGPPPLPYAMWADISNDWGWGPGPGPPPGYVECDEFISCEWLWVWGWDFEPCQTYTIWIQPYEAGLHVADGDMLDPALCPPGFPPADLEDIPDPCGPDGWMPGWVEVHIDEAGTFGPVPIWHVDGEYCELWEIVADKTDAAATNPGFYGANEDGLDAACLGEWGFHIYPEGLTIILLSLGLVAVGGYLVVRRRRGAETDS